MKYLYSLGTVAALLMVFLAPDPDNMFARFAFILLALFLGYLILRHRFRLRYYLRLKHAFNTERHHARRWARQYRKKQNTLFQTV